MSGACRGELAEERDFGSPAGASQRAIHTLHTAAMTLEEEAAAVTAPAPPQPLETIRSQEALLTADAPATERLLAAPPERAFEPHDVRESALRFRYPVLRQRWLKLEGSNRRVNSADREKRGMPPYLLIMDLAFSALITDVARVTVGTDGINGLNNFWFLYCPLGWMWMTLNLRYAVADPEDISAELFVFASMTVLLYLVYLVRPCFIADVVGDGTGACTDWIVAYGLVRALNLALAAYIAYHLRDYASGQFAKEVVSCLFTGATAIAIPFGWGWDHGTTIQLWAFASFAFDVALHFSSVWLAVVVDRADERLHSSGKSVRKESVPTAKRWRPGACLSLLVSTSSRGTSGWSSSSSARSSRAACAT